MEAKQQWQQYENPTKISELNTYLKWEKREINGTNGTHFPQIYYNQNAALPVLYNP